MPGNGRYLQADRLVASPVLAAQGPAYGLLRRTLGAAVLGTGRADSPTQSPTHLFIRRGNTQQRRLLNEDDAIAALAPLGFVGVTLDQLGVAEQIRLIANARAIVAPHGAALTNTVFCEPGTQILELFASVYRDTSFAAIARHCNLVYNRRIVPVADNLPTNCNYWIDPTALATIVEDLGMGAAIAAP